MSGIDGADVSCIPAASAARQPSILEVVAHDSFASSVQPAVRHLIKWLYESDRSFFKWLWEWHDEVYAALQFLIENYYLKQYGGSLAENFYGLKRVINGTRISPSMGVPKLRSLLMLVGWPYLLSKVEKFNFELPTYTSRTRGNSLKHFLSRCFRWIKILFSTWSLLLKFGYIVSWWNIHSPELQFANVHLEKLTPADFVSFNKSAQRRSWRTLTLLASIITSLITYGLYFIQFLDFYYNSDTGNSLRTQLTPNRRYPPAPHKRLRESSVLLLEPNKCPLCLRQRSNDTVLSVSGYVFCYRCIHSFIQREKKCPVTGLPARVDHLIRIFINPI